MSIKRSHRKRRVIEVIGSPIDAVNWAAAISQIQQWAAGHESRYVCICNVHSVVTARRDRGFNEVIQQSDMCTADGAPLAWLMSFKGRDKQERINGPDLMYKYIESIEETEQSIFLYGGTDFTLDKLRSKLLARFPGLNIAGMYSPPFRELDDSESEKIVEMINESGANTVWVGLGCPKQEKWMKKNRGHINAVMIGVGAAFDYHAETVKRAPLWMQEHGMEWLYRLFSEPRRLWKRYLTTNLLFVYFLLKDSKSKK